MRFRFICVLSLPVLIAHAWYNSGLMTKVAFQPQAAPVVTTRSLNFDRPTLHAAETPSAVFAGIHDSAQYEIPSVSDIAILATGLVALAPLPPFEVRIFTATGRYVRTIGRRGEGPGEFISISQVRSLRGDTLAVVDISRRTVTLFDGKGAVVVSARAPGIPNCCLPNGNYLTRSDLLAPAGGTRTPPAASGELLLRSIRDGATIASVPLPAEDPTIRLGPFQQVIRGTTTRSFVNAPVPFGRKAHVVFAGDNIITMSSDRYEFNIFGSNGVRLRTVRVPNLNINVDSKLRQAARAQFLSIGTDSAQRRLMAETFDTLTIPTTAPAISRLVGDADGSVWIRSFDVPGESDIQRWAKFGNSGELQGTLTLPDSTHVLGFARGSVILREPVSTAQGVRIAVRKLEQRVR